MKNINNNFIKSAFKLLSIFSFSLILVPTLASADFQGFQYSYTDNSSSGYNNSSTPWNYNNNLPNPIPILYAVTPNGASGTIGNMAIVLHGANFIPSSIAEFNGTYRSTSYNNQNQLTMVLNAADLATPGNYVITVFNQMPGGGNSNGVFFSVSPMAVATPPASTTDNSLNDNPPVNNNAAPATTPKNNAAANATTDKANSDLAATPLLASSGFMPSNFIQWLIAALLILVTVFMARKIYAKEKGKNTPLKHA